MALVPPEQDGSARRSLAAVLSPIVLLRIGLGLTLLYAAVRALADPMTWIGFVPSWVAAVLPAATLLAIHAVAELLVGGALIVGRWVRAASFIAFLDFAAILIAYGIDEVTFRDFGLLFAALALFFIVTEQRVR